MTVSLAFDDGQQAIHDALASWCAEQGSDDAIGRIAWSRTLWSELAEFGVFAPCTEAGEGGALEIVAALEALGAAGCPGPFAGTFFATQALRGADVDRIADGRALVSLGERGLFPFGSEADLFIELDGAAARMGASLSGVEHSVCLGGEPVARGTLDDPTALDALERAHALTDVVRAAWIASCGHALVGLAAEHARTRKQFKKALGDFQAVAHPLADSHMALSAATGLARAAGYAFDHDAAAPVREAAKARLSASAAALDTIHVVHQVFGAVGITLEGPIYHLTRRLRQSVGDAPSADHARAVVLGGLGW